MVKKIKKETEKETNKQTNTKQTILDEVLKDIEKQFGKGSIMKLWDNTVHSIVKTYHTGSYMIDDILWGGYPEGRIIEIYGPESSGKTTLTLHAIAEVQKVWESAAFIDAEHALDPIYAQKLGVDINNLILAQPDYGEQALEIAEKLASSGAVKLIVIDSVAALIPKAEVEWDMSDQQMWLQARMMSKWLRKLTSIAAKTWTMIIFINQIRMKIGVMFGNPETTTGGNALKFFATQRIEIRRWEKIEENKEQMGYKAKVKVVKNKIAPPFKSCEVVIRFNQGIDEIADLVEIAMNKGIITRAGAFYSLYDQKFQGKNALIKEIKENEQLKEKLGKDIENTIKWWVVKDNSDELLEDVE
jgi:recombination protein RecA